MKIVKPLHLGIISRTFKFRSESFFSAAILLGIPLLGGEPLLEQDMWAGIMKGLEPHGIFDAGMPKDKAEFLAVGSFFSAGGRPVEAGRAEIAVGDAHKALAVFGDRHWRAGVGPSSPGAMSAMPLSYANAFGGEGFAPNPTGKGMPASQAGGERPLPNVEDLAHLIGSPSDRPAPAGFGPLDLTWEYRAEKRGTYDERWQRERAPGLPDDLDWSFFNAAPPDQWFAEPLKGDEPFAIKNMHPSHPHIEGRLPAVVGRCFLEYRKGGEWVFDEMPMRLETVWFLPEQELGVLLWRGNVKLDRDDLDEVRKLLLGFEGMDDAQRPIDHYREELHKRTDADDAFKHWLDTRALIPDGYRCGFERLGESRAETLEMLRKQNLDAFAEEKRAEAKSRANEALARGEQARSETEAKLREHGLDPALHMPKDESEPAQDPRLEKLLTIGERMAPKVEDGSGRLDLKRLDLSVLEEVSPLVNEIREDKKAEVVAATTDAVERMVSAGALSREEADAHLAKLTQPKRLPRPPGDELLSQLREQLDHVAKLRAQVGDRSEQPKDLPGLDVDLASLERRIAAFGEKMKAGYRKGAHLTGGGVPPHHGREAEVRQSLLDRHRRGESLAGGDYAGLDLAGLDLSSADFSGAYLEDANLTGTCLRGANLTDAIMARANLTGADLSGARLPGANIGATVLDDADLSETDLEGAVLSGARATGARLSRSRLDGVQLLNASFQDTDFSGADMKGLRLIDTPLRGCRFHGADLTGTVMVKPDLDRADFSEARADETTWVGAKGADVSFSRASLVNARFMGGVQLEGADFSGAKLDRANLGEARLAGATFEGAALNMAYLGKAELAQCRFSGAQAIRGAFIKANLRGAVLSAANLMEASFHQAALVGADCRGSNLYSADFMQSTLGDVDFRDANLDRTILQDWRPA